MKTGLNKACKKKLFEGIVAFAFYFIILGAITKSDAFMSIFWLPLGEIMISISLQVYVTWCYSFCGNMALQFGMTREDINKEIQKEVWLGFGCFSVLSGLYMGYVYLINPENIFLTALPATYLISLIMNVSAVNIGEISVWIHKKTDEHVRLKRILLIVCVMGAEAAFLGMYVLEAKSLFDGTYITAVAGGFLAILVIAVIGLCIPAKKKQAMMQELSL